MSFFFLNRTQTLKQHRHPFCQTHNPASSQEQRTSIFLFRWFTVCLQSCGGNPNLHLQCVGYPFWWELRGGISELSAGRSGGAYGVVGGTEEGTCCGCLLTSSRDPGLVTLSQPGRLMTARVDALFSCSHTSFCHILMLLLLYFLSHSSGGVQGSYGQPCMTRGDWIPFEWSVIVGETRGPIQHCECELRKKKGKDKTMEWRAANVNPGWFCYQKGDGKI